MTSNALFEKIARNKPLDFGDIFNKSIELFKKVWLQGFLHLLIMLLITVPLFILVYVASFLPVFGVLLGTQGHVDSEPFVAMSVMTILSVVLFFLGTVIVVMIGFAIKANFYRVCKNADQNVLESSSFFTFLNKKYFKKVFLLSMITIALVLLGVALCVVPVLYLMVPLELLMVVFAFNPKRSASDLLRASFRLGNNKWLLVFGLMMVSSLLISVAGSLMCFIGGFFISSFSYIPVYYVYKETIGFDDELENNETLFVN